MISAGLGWTELLHGTVPHDVPHPPALVARLGPDVGAVLDDVPDLVTVVAGVLLLSAVLGDVSGAVTFVAAVLLLSTLTTEVRTRETEYWDPPLERNAQICCTCSTSGLHLHCRSRRLHHHLRCALERKN